MRSQEYLQQNLLTLMKDARFAPSVHNTQPWKVKLSHTSLKVIIDDRYTLEEGDPTGRQTIISIGIFTEAIIVSAEARGLITELVDFNNKEVIITFAEEMYTPTSEKTQQVEFLRRRSTDRSVYHKAAIPSQATELLTSVASEDGIKVWLREDEISIQRVAECTASGIGLALTSPGFRKELSQFLIEPWSKRKRGISVRSMYVPIPMAIAQPFMVRMGIGLRKEIELEKRRWYSASGIVLITSKGDMPQDWFNAGRVYLRVSIMIEKLGFSQATSAASVEASNYHEDIEKMLGTTQRLQCVLRIGTGSKHRNYSPRVDAESLITS